MSRRIGLFGGTFDPPHLGHLAIAEAALEQLSLDRLEWVVNLQPPHRPAPVASAEDRLEMVRLATAGQPEMIVSDREIRRGGVSYTVDSLSEMRQEGPDDLLFLIIGADSYDDLLHWRDPDRIRRLAELAVVSREGARPLRPEPGVIPLSLPPLPFKARDVRSALAHGAVPDSPLSPSVLKYILARGLYRATESSS